MSMASSLSEVPHPGEFLRDELEARAWSQRDLAYILGVPEQAVNMIAAGKRGISPDMARALGEAFDIDAEFFANLQKAHEMANARQPDPGIARRAKLQATYPVREMIRRGWLEDTDIAMMEAQMQRFFNVASNDDIPHLAHAAKKTGYDEVPPAQLAWLFRVRQLADEMIVPNYTEKKLRDALVTFRQFVVDPEEVRHVPRVLAECGVRFLIVETLPGAKIDGVCFWMGATPVIGISTRHDRIDNFWFVLRHEIEHVLQQHGKDEPIVDAELEGDNAGVGSNVSDQERVANAAAAAFCVPQDDMNSFFMRKAPFFAERDILGFARRVQVHPGLVVGQIQNRTKRFDFLRKHLVRVRHFVVPAAIVDGWGQQATVLL